MLEKHCALKGFEVVKIFQDDCSAWKGFDRPEYNELKKFLKNKTNDIDIVLFTQWSRFSRDYTESVIEIRRLKNSGIEVNASGQPIDFSIPENHYLLALYLTAPQVENDRLSHRTIAGMRQALKQGRWLWKAPYGYKNNQIEKRIEIIEPACNIVKSCFEMLSTGLYQAEEVRRKHKPKGLELGKQGFLNMLENVLYTGRIRVPAYQDECEIIINASHPAIISIELFAKVQLVLSGKKKPYKIEKNNSAIPLVDFLYCPKCHKRMTGSPSRGNGGIYYYYHCQRKFGCNNNINANKANNIFVEFLKTGNLNLKRLNYIRRFWRLNLISADWIGKKKKRG